MKKQKKILVGEIRIKGLKTMRDKDKQINYISKADNIVNLFPQYN